MDGAEKKENLLPNNKHLEMELIDVYPH